MSLLSGPKIVELVKEGVLVVNPPPADKAIGPNSVDLRLGSKLRVYKAQLNFLARYRTWSVLELFNNAAVKIDQDCVLDPYEINDTVDLEIGPSGLTLVPGILYIGHTIEAAGSRTRYAPMLEGKSTWARLGVQTHKSAGYGDLAFARTWTLEIEVSTPVRVRAGDYVCQVAFHEVDGPELLYTKTGHYADQDGPVAARPLVR